MPDLRERVARALCRVWVRRSTAEAVKLGITNNPVLFLEAEQAVEDDNWPRLLEEADAAIAVIGSADFDDCRKHDE